MITTRRRTETRSSLRWFLYLFLFFFVTTVGGWWLWAKVINIGPEIQGMKKRVTEDYLFYFPTGWERQNSDPVAAFVYAPADQSSTSLKLVLENATNDYSLSREQCEQNVMARTAVMRELYGVAEENLSGELVEYGEEEDISSCLSHFELVTGDQTVKLQQREVHRRGDKVVYQVNVVYEAEDEYATVAGEAQKAFFLR